MTPQMVVSVGREALMVTLMLAGPLLLVALVVGLVISLVQAVTQIHEMTLTFVPKIIAISLTLLLLLPWMITIATDFTRHMMEMIPTLAGG
jgi:flagellar biosynthetic protein FliQ